MKRNLAIVLLCVSSRSFCSQDPQTIQHRLANTLAHFVDELNTCAYENQENRITETKMRLLKLVRFVETKQDDRSAKVVETMRTYMDTISPFIVFKSGFSSRDYKEEVERLLVRFLNEKRTKPKSKRTGITIPSLLKDFDEKLGLRIQLEGTIHYDNTPATILKQLKQAIKPLLLYDSKFSQELRGGALEMKCNLFYAFCESVPAGIALPDGMRSDYYKIMLAHVVAATQKKLQTKSAETRSLYKNLQDQLYWQLRTLQNLLNDCKQRPIDTYVQDTKELVPLSILKEEQEIVDHIATLNASSQLGPESLIPLMSMINEIPHIQLGSVSSRPLKEQVLNTMLAMLDYTNTRAQSRDRAA